MKDPNALGEGKQKEGSDQAILKTNFVLLEKKKKPEVLFCFKSSKLLCHYQ